MRYSTPLSYNPIDVARITEVLNRYEGIHHNQIVTDFELAISKVTGSTHAVALNSGTAAIHLALKVLGIGVGDYVLAPSFTYIATINPILYLGAHPVLIDSETTTWNMDPHLVEEALEVLKKEGKRPKAMVVVHTYGMPSQLNQLLAIARKEGISVVEDAAESLGSTYQRKMVGTFGDVGIFSFNNNKVVTTYGGGILLTERPELAEKARFLATQSRENLPYYHHSEVGYNYAMGPLNAAQGLSQLIDLQDNVTKRRLIFERYRIKLEGYVHGQQCELPDMYSNRWFSCFLFKDEATKGKIANVLGSRGIETRPLWNPMHRQQLLINARYFGSREAELLFNRGLCLPSGHNLTEDKIDEIVQVITQ